MIIDIYKILFKENFTPSVFFLLVALIVAETYFLIKLESHNKISNAVVVGITAVSLVFSISLVSRPNNVTEKYDTWYAPKANGSGCMAEAFKETDPSGDYYFNTITFNHYFDGKEIIISDDIETKDEIAAYLYAFSSAENIEFSEKYSDSISTSLIGVLENKINFIEKDSRKYFLDKTWKDTKRIVGISIEDSVYFMSEELYNDALNNNCEADYLTTREKEMSAGEYMNNQRGERTVNHMLLLFAFFIVGYIPCRILFNGKMKALSAFVSFPVGLSIATTWGIALIILGIPYRKSALIVSILLILAPEIIFAVKNKNYFEKCSICKELCVAVLLDIMVVQLKVFKFCSDSANKMWCAYILAEGKAEKGDILASSLPWGMLEPIIHAFGWKFKADIVYGIYMGTFICSIGIIISAAYYLSKKENKTAVTVLAIICAGIYAANNDAFIIGIWAHGNGPTGCMILAVLVVTYASLVKELPTKWLATVLGFSIIVTRVEGGLYVCLFLLLFCALDKRSTRFSIVLIAELLLWEIINVIIVPGHIAEENLEFWTEQKAIILIALGMVTILIIFLINLNNKITIWIKSNYYKISILFGIVASMGMFIVNYDIAYSSARVFARHFGTSLNSNAGVFWGYVVLMLPLLLICKKKKTRFLIAFVIDYILLQFLIYCVRDSSDPIHIEIGDSCRRTMQQILSTIMVAIPLIWDELYDGTKKFLEER